MSIASAIHGRNLLTFIYDGYRRTVEPHTLGVDAKGHTALRAFQVTGGSESGEHIGWKLFHASEMHSIAIQPQTFSGPRPGYKQGDKAFASIKAQL
ncbi:WYL domain-containing protein [Rubrivivax gelatinosus]|uniref:hypothetical protein n=1 Tax=Rubrivivax gelatinosus TaxID=28068 RepID=UPI001902F4C4|nr:hypothetical protein [Rubrivivax gelatinosus]